MERSPKKIILLSITLALAGLTALPWLMCKEVTSGGLKHRTIPYNTSAGGYVEITASGEHLEYLSGMYDELMGFKDSREFRSYGFNQEGPYFQWMSQLQNWIESNSVSSALPLAEDLKNLAEIYVRSYGVDNYETTLIRENLESALLTHEN